MKLLLILMLAMMASQETKPTIIYIGDPMCSWCYGFSDELNKVKNHYKGIVELNLVMGGLRPYNTESMLDLKTFLSHHWKDVGDASGVKFNYGILDRDDIKYDTEPPSRACIVVRELKPELEYAFFKAVQSTFYLENKDLNKIESYFDILDSLGIDKKQFEALFDSERMKLKVKDDFINAQSLGVRSFPTVVLKLKGKYYAVANGYVPSKTIIERIDLLFKNSK